jgi:hypothetical protein
LQATLRVRNWAITLKLTPANVANDEGQLLDYLRKVNVKTGGKSEPFGDVRANPRRHAALDLAIQKNRPYVFEGQWTTNENIKRVVTDTLRFEREQPEVCDVRARAYGYHGLQPPSENKGLEFIEGEARPLATGSEGEQFYVLGRGQAVPTSAYSGLTAPSELMPETYRVGRVEYGSKYQGLPDKTVEEAIAEQNARFGHDTPSGRRNVTNATPPRMSSDTSRSRDRDPYPRPEDFK